MAWVRMLGFLLMGFVALCSATEMGPKKELPDDTLFQDRAAFCDGCYALVQEVEKLMTKWKREKGSMEDRIDTALTAVCDTDRLRAYVLSPPKMLRLCTGIRAHYTDQIGLALLKHYAKKETRTVDQLFEDICRKAIPACPKGLTPMTKAREESRKKAEEEKEKETKAQPAEDRKEKPASEKQHGKKEQGATEKKKDEL